jgi:hypothetical protein
MVSIVAAVFASSVDSAGQRDRVRHRRWVRSPHGATDAEHASMPRHPGWRNAGEVDGDGMVKVGVSLLSHGGVA